MQKIIFNEQPMDSAYIYYCDQSGRVFELSTERGYDSMEFIRTILKSKIAYVYYSNKSYSNWLGDTYVLDEFEHFEKFKHGNVLNSDFMYWAGYLYRAWSTLYSDTPLEMLEQAPTELLRKSFLGLHVMSYELAIIQLKELYIHNHLDRS